MKHAMTAAKEAEILRMVVVQRKMLGDVAQLLALSRTRVESVAVQYGWPDQDVMRKALEDLELDALASPEPAQTAGGGEAPVGKSFELVPVAALHPDPDNPREKLKGIAELAESIESQGLIQPIVARRRGGRLVIVAGHRRHAAMQHLGRDKVEVIITRDMPSDDVLAQMLVENGQRTGLDPIEEARALSELKARSGKSMDEIGALIGRSQPWVSNRIKLLNLPPSYQEKVRAGDMSPSEAIERLRDGMGGNYGTRQGPRLTYSFHLGSTHPLAAAAKTLCRKNHVQQRLVGNTACGKCWEDVIRADERALAVDPAPAAATA